MSTKHRVVLVVLVALATTLDVARAFDHDDAATGGDAGDHRNDATYLPAYGSYEGDLVGSGDDDWFWRPDHETQPVCVWAKIEPASAIKATLRLSTPNGTRTVSMNVSAGATQRMGLASPSLYLSRVGIENGPTGVTPYAFTLGLTPLSSQNGDAGTGFDAGSGAMTAIPTSDPCTQGSLVSAFGIPDVDTYSISVRPGETVYYSVASTSSDVRVALTDGAGALLGPAARAGEVVGVYLPEGGTYYMSASSSSPTNAAYLLGAMAGPDPVTNPCRPNCMIVS